MTATGGVQAPLRADAKCGYAKLHPDASVLLCTVPCFSDTSSKMSALTVLYWLHELHVVVDEICREFQGLWKFTGTSGNFILASGVVANVENHADVLVSVAFKLLEKVSKLSLPAGGPAYVRLSIHSGEVAAGVIGTKGLQYQVYGPVVDVAHVVTASAIPGTIKVTEATMKLLTKQLPWKYSGVVSTPCQNVKSYELTVHESPLAKVQSPPPPSSVPTLRSRWSSSGKEPVSSSTCSGDSNGSYSTQQAWNMVYDHPKLEKYFLRRFHTSHVTLDHTFICIALLSQGTWLLKWNFNTSYLGLVMVALMLFNVLHLFGAVFFRDLYVAHREKVCVVSHLLHKISQLVITVSYPHGTVYSASYNPTVALVESSCFAQVLILAYGLRLRFPVQLVVGLLHMLISFVANSSICRMAWPGVPAALCIPALSLFQLSACYALPSALIYFLEVRARRSFAEAHDV